VRVAYQNKEEIQALTLACEKRVLHKGKTEGIQVLLLVSDTLECDLKVVLEERVLRKGKMKILVMLIAPGFYGIKWIKIISYSFLMLFIYGMVYGRDKKPLL